MVFGYPLELLMGQVMLGLINGSFYALLSLGLAVIFGMLNIINFAHGAFFMMGAYVAWMLLNYLGINYWLALILSPLAVALFGFFLERTMIRRLYNVDSLYGLLLTLGLALVIEGVFRYYYSASGLPYRVPEALRGIFDFGIVILPKYRVWAVAAAVTMCILTWLVIERTPLGATLRAAQENPMLVRAFGIRVPRLLTLTYCSGLALAAFAGVLAAPIYSVNPNMGSNFIIIVFAVVVIGGMGSIMGSVVTGISLGVIEGITKVFYPQASATVIFILMVVVLLIRPNGLFGKSVQVTPRDPEESHSALDVERSRFASQFRIGGFSGIKAIAVVALSVLLFVVPFVTYPVFVMKILCLAIFATAFNLLLGYVGLMSFGHAAYFGIGAYASAWTMKELGLSTELGILCGMVAGAVFGAVFGWVAIRRQGLYFAMITLALAQMLYFFCLQVPFTGGEDGIQNVPRGRLFGAVSLDNDRYMYWVVAALFLVTLFAVQRIIHSPFGQILKGIRENEPRLVSLGYRVNQYKLAAFTLSAALSGLAGGLKAIVFSIATLTDVFHTTSADVVLMTLVGGLATTFGPLVGAIVLATIQTKFAEFGAWVTVLQGLIFMVCVLTFRKGIMGWLGSQKIFVGKKAKTEGALRSVTDA